MFFLSRLIVLSLFFNTSFCVIELGIAAAAKLAITFSLGYSTATRIERKSQDININNNIICDSTHCRNNK